MTIRNLRGKYKLNLSNYNSNALYTSNRPNVFFSENSRDQFYYFNSDILITLYFSQQKKQLRVFVLIFILVFTGWVTWTNSYWADTGYYDSYRIPIGNKKQTEGVFGEGVAMINGDSFQTELAKVYLTKTKVYGISENGSDTTYIIYNIYQNVTTKYLSYDAYLKSEGISKEKMLAPVDVYYTYWGKLLWLYD